MKIKNAVSIFVLVLLAINVQAAEPLMRITAGDTRVEAVKSDRKIRLDIYFGERKLELFDKKPVSLWINGELCSAYYSECIVDDGALVCSSKIVSRNGSEFNVADTYSVQEDNCIKLHRTIDIGKAVKGDDYFNSLYGFDIGRNADFDRLEFFIPAVWYKPNFTPEGNIPPQIPQENDTVFLYRNDRIPLPIVMTRDPEDGLTCAIIQKGPVSRSVMADRDGMHINAGYQFGSLGVTKSFGRMQMLFAYPGTEKGRRGGAGARSHPVSVNVRHSYVLELYFARTKDYADAVDKSWNQGFMSYDPQVYVTDSRQVYNGLIETLLAYYVPSVRYGGVYDEPGFPFQVSLKDFKPMGIDYQMGFVGMQVATGYYLYRAGIENGDRETMLKGKDVLDFWSAESLTALGYPRCWYDPKNDGTQGKFRRHSTLRTTTSGMESLLEAWCFARRNKIFNPKWIDACRKFGRWLVDNQNADGSWYFAYNHNKIAEGRHPATNKNKYLTVCTIRYLVNLYIATSDSRYRDAALRAGEFCYENIHRKYAYVACVTDNPQTIDSESGQMALNAFLSLYDLTGEKRWLDAAEQAATYAETWTYMQDIPVEEDCNTPLVVPKDRSIVGQHLIAIGHAGADLGFTWNSFNFYRLYLITGKEHYRKVARIAAHNTKQTMNWDESLYPGQPRGLQLEAFRISVPRRGRGVQTTLNWNYAANLDPMIRFKDAFGSCDIEQIDKMPIAELRRLNTEYGKVQSADID